MFFSDSPLNYNTSPLEIDCGYWQPGKADEIIRVGIFFDENLQAQFDFKCSFADCSDIVAFGYGDIDNELYPYQVENFVDAGDYFVFKDPLVINLEPMYSFCNKNSLF